MNSRQPSPFTSLREVSEAFFRYTDLEQMIRQTLHAALDVLAAEAGSVLLADTVSKQLVFHYVVGSAAPTLQGTGIPWDKGIAGAVFRSGQPEVIPTVHEDARHYTMPETVTGYRSHDMAAVPLKRHGGNPIGVIEVINKKTGAITPEDLDMLVVISAIAAAAIEQSKAFEAIRSKDMQLQQAQKMEAIGRLAGGVAHDFNNLLTVIRGYSELLAAGLQHDGMLRGHLDEVLKATERASALTSQLLAFSRKQVVNPRVVRLALIVTEVEKLLRRLIGEHIELVINLKEPNAWVLADPSQMEQVLINLAVNARDAMLDGGTLTIETGLVELPTNPSERHLDLPSGLYCALSVTDTGCGMTPETLARLFEPFFTTKGPGKGTGLGLSIVHGIVKQSRGDIVVTSVPNVGTTFTIYLPFASPRENEAAAVQHPPVRGGTETVLVAEDERHVRMLERAILMNSGYTVLETGNVDEALRICREYGKPIHVLVTDLVMPGMNGRALADEILALRPTTKVLFVSGYPDDTLLSAGLRPRTAPVLQKPFAADALLRAVRGVLDEGKRASGITQDSSPRAAEH